MRETKRASGTRVDSGMERWLRRSRVPMWRASWGAAVAVVNGVGREDCVVARMHRMFGEVSTC